MGCALSLITLVLSMAKVAHKKPFKDELKQR
jgi:hypothetical protein